MKYLITGSSGFIGQEVCSKLTKINHEVIGIDKVSCDHYGRIPFCKQYIGNILDISFLQSVAKDHNNIDFVIHLAARTDLSNESVAMYIDNTIGTINIIKIFQPLKGFVFASTQLVNKPGTFKGNLQEFSPHTSYGESKCIAEQLIKTQCDYPYIIIRPTTVWGPYCSSHYLNFWIRASKGIYFHSCFSSLKSYGYISNVASIFIEATEKITDNNHEIIYACDKNPIEIVSYVNKITSYMGRKIPIIILPKMFSFLIGLLGSILKIIGINTPYYLFRRRNIITEILYPPPLHYKSVENQDFTLKEAIQEFAKWLKEYKSQNNL